MRDYSSRTSAVRTPYIISIAMVVILIFSTVMFVVGNVRYSREVARSSSSVGTVLNFKRSDAKISLKGLYTDESGSALVARFGANADSLSKLPYAGKDYRLFVESPNLPRDRNEMSMLFGRLSTDGDMFLVIPKPSKSAIYTVFIMNTVYLGLSDNSSLSKDQITNAEKSITETISRQTHSLDPKAEPYSIKSDTADIVSLRLTMDPALKTQEFTPIVIKDVTLLDGKEFNFEGLFNKVFKESAVSQLTIDHERLLADEKQTIEVMEEYSKRLAVNSADAVAAESYADAAQKLESIQTDKAEIASQLTAYDNLMYSNEMFANIQTKAKIIHE